MKVRHTNIPASYLLLLQDYKVLLSQRANTGYHDGEYSVIAGHVEAGETFTDTIMREAKEEAGILLDRNHLKVAHIQHRKSDSDGSERVHTYFVATAWTGDVKNLESEKCSDLGWFDLNHLPENMVECVRAALQNINAGVFYSEFGWE